MSYKVKLFYFRVTGKFLATVDITVKQEDLVDIWDEIDSLRRLGRLPGLRPGAGRDLFIIVDVPDHPKRVLHMVTPPFIDEDDVTPPRIPTGEMAPLPKIQLDELTARTSTRDVVKITAEEAEADTVVLSGDDVTPIDLPPSKKP